MGPARKIEGFPVLTAKGEIRGRGLPVDDTAQLFALWIHDPYPPGSTTIDVAFLIHLHTIGHAGLATPQLGKDPVSLLGEGTVGQQVEGADVATPGVVNVEHAFIGGEGEPV